MWPPRNDKTVLAKVYSSWDQAKETQVPAAQVQTKAQEPKTKKQKQDKAETGKVFRETKFAPSLFYTTK